MIEALLDQIKSNLNKIIELSENGEVDELKTYGLLKSYKLDDLIKESQYKLEDVAMEAFKLSSDDQKEFKGFGYVFTHKNGGERLSYKNIPEWSDIKEDYDSKRKVIESKYKANYNAVKNGLMTASEEGEEMLIPEIIFTKSSLMVKKIKK